MYLQFPNDKNIEDSCCLEKLCSLRWLKPKRKRVKNVNPVGSNLLYTLLSRGRMNDNSLLLNIETEFLILSSNLYQSFRVEGEKILKTVWTTVKSWYTVYPGSSSLLNFWNQIDEIIRGFFFQYLRTKMLIPSSCPKWLKSLPLVDFFARSILYSICDS